MINLYYFYYFNYYKYNCHNYLYLNFFENKFIFHISNII